MAKKEQELRQYEGQDAFNPSKELNSSNPYMDSGEWQDFADGWNAAARAYAAVHPSYSRDKFKNLSIKVYQDIHGYPTCAKNFVTGEFCLFLRMKKFGTLEVCSLASDTSHHADKLNRRLDSKQ